MSVALQRCVQPWWEGGADPTRLDVLTFLIGTSTVRIGAASGLRKRANTGEQVRETELNSDLARGRKDESEARRGKGDMTANESRT